MESIKVREFLSVGSGYGFGYGSGYGFGDGDGYGSGSGSGYGDGYGYGIGIKSFNGHNVFLIDDTQTIITSVCLGVAKGFILQNDLTLTPCYVVKSNNLFAHGDTIKSAQSSLQKKILDNMDISEKIEMFIKEFKPNIEYPAKAFYEWHHTLTGSCEAGRMAFIKDIGADIDKDTYTVDEFLNITKNAYGKEIISELKETWDGRTSP